MKYSIAAGALLLASSVIAAPGTDFRYKRNVARRGNLLNRIDVPDHAKTNKTNVQYSSNWSGAVLVGNGYTSVVGTFNAPSPSSSGSGSAWVGIDGDTCQSAILQTGIDWTRSSSGSISYSAWYEWFPDYQYNFNNLPISAGDSIKVSVVATGTESGTATVDNLTKGVSQTHTFTRQTEGSLCYENAEWIVEDYEEGSSLVPFADYGSLSFVRSSSLSFKNFAMAEPRLTRCLQTGASATDNGGSVDTSGSQILYMQNSNGNTISQCSASGSTVSCQYT